MTDRPVKTINRGVVLVCCAVCGGLTGAIYMWSIFKIPLMQATGLSSTTITFAYSLFEIMALISSLLCGLVLKKVKISTLVGIAGAGFGLGWLLTGFADTAWKLYLFFSIIGGLSDGFIYNSTVSVVMRWFPDKRGFANGICIGAMGLAPLFFAPLGNAFIEHFDVFTAFMLCGGIFIVMRFTFGWFVKNPPEGYMPAGWDPAKTEAVISKKDIATKDMFKMPLFYVILVFFTFADCAALMLTAHASAIGQEMCGLSASQGAALVGLMAVGSFLGRFGFGALSDGIGRYKALSIALIITALDMFFLIGQAGSFVEFMLTIGLVGLCYGGVMTIVPSLTADIFGNKYFSSNYAWMFAGFTAASFIGPMLAAAISEKTGSYETAFILAGILSVISLALVLTASKLNKKLNAVRED